MCTLDRARYLIVRLALRKAGKWYRLSALKYESELGKSIPSAITELCQNTVQVQVDVKVKEEPEIIDLTLDEDEVQPPTPQPKPELDLTVFAEDESQMSLQELLESLHTDELKAIAKERKLKTTQRVCLHLTMSVHCSYTHLFQRPTLIYALLMSHCTQSMINFPVVSASSSKSNGKVKDKTPTYQTCLSFGSNLKTDDRLREIVIKKLGKIYSHYEITGLINWAWNLGKCIRVNPLVLSLFRRINLIYFRRYVLIYPHFLT
jgi:Fanconi-associated nuclease 1